MADRTTVQAMCLPQAVVVVVAAALVARAAGAADAAAVAVAAVAEEADRQLALPDAVSSSPEAGVVDGKTPDDGWQGLRRWRGRRRQHGRPARARGVHPQRRLGDPLARSPQPSRET